MLSPLLSSVSRDLGLWAAVSEFVWVTVLALTQGPTVKMFTFRHKHGKQGLRETVFALLVKSVETVCTLRNAFYSFFGLFNVFPLGCKCNFFFCISVEEQAGLIQHRKEIHWWFNMPVTCSAAHKHDFLEMLEHKTEN